MTTTIGKMPSGNLNNVLIERKHMRPLWLFSDHWDGLYTKGKFCCFIGAHYPAHMFNDDAMSHEACIERLNNGAWKLEQLQNLKDPKAMVGFGFGNTPSEAFRAACYSAGYIKKVIT